MTTIENFLLHFNNIYLSDIVLLLDWLKNWQKTKFVDRCGELHNIHTKSLYITHPVSNFYETEIEIWTGFGPVGNTEKKKIGPIMSTF